MDEFFKRITDGPEEGTSEGEPAQNVREPTPPPARVPVKIEVDDYNESSGSSPTTSDPNDLGMSTGLDEMAEEMEAKKKKEVDDMVKLAAFMDKEEKEPTGLFRKRRGKKKTPQSDEEKANEDDEEGKPPKGPLKTFGHSSRTRRLVNYADIEKGADAQSQSLVVDFNTGKRRNKRTRDEMDENYEESNNGNPAKKKNIRKSKTPWIPNPQHVYTIQPQQSDVDSNREFDLALLLPAITDDRPAEEDRTIGKALDEFTAIRRSSGGFRRFVAWLKDSVILNLMKQVEERYMTHSDTEDKRLIKTIRHSYNSMPFSYKRDWEHAAKMDVFESRIFVQGLSMPLSEIQSRCENEPVKPTNSRIDSISIRPNCCSAEPLVSDMRQVAEHYLQFHDIVHLFGCDICHRIFTSKYELTKHDCPEFGQILLELTMKGQKLNLDVAHMFLCCCQCGLWLPVKTSIAGMKGWNYFATALTNHSCQPLVAVAAHFRKALPEEGKSVRMIFNLICYVDVGFPMNCEECGTEDFKSVDEAEEHFKENHNPLQCSKCSAIFGTEFLFRHHAQVHLAQSAQFANYLTYSATYHPPPFSGRNLHIGYQSEIPAVGGCTAPEVEMMEAADLGPEFVEPKERTFVKKMLRWCNSHKSGTPQSDCTYSNGSSCASTASTPLESASSSSTDEYDSDSKSSNRKIKKKKLDKPKKEVRGDLGYSHLDKAAMLQQRGQVEQETIDILEKVMGKKLFRRADRLQNSGEVVGMLRDGVKQPELQVPQHTLADDIAEKITRTVNLPASNCIDPLKDLLLVNKIFYYCPVCHMVFSSDPQAHCTTVCNTDEENIIELYHAAAGPFRGIRCVVEGCELNLCSVTSLRNHCSLVHNLPIALEMILPTTADEMLGHRYDRSIMMLAKHFQELQTDKRTHLARFTDIECYLPYHGFLEKRPQKFVHPLARQQLQINQPGGRKLPIVARPLYVKPYRPRNTRWYSCQWCDREFEQLPDFIQHLIKTHTNFCQRCGRGFANLTTRRTHVCSQTFQHELQKSDVVLAGGCPLCKERHPISRLFEHYLKRHFASVEYNKNTGEIYPQPALIRYEPLSIHQSLTRIHGASNIYTGPNIRNDYRLKLIKMSATPVHGVNLNQLSKRPAPIGSFSLCPPEVKNIDPRLMCYLCELTFDSSSELRGHLSEAHAEKWSKCPLCHIPVGDHFDLQKHLLSEHVDRTQSKIMCSFCKEANPRFMCSHLLFRCKKKPCCTICGLTGPDPTVNYAHMRRAHSVTFRRFQCAFCSNVFVSLGEYYEHICQGQQARVYSCVCSPEMFFSTVASFCDHYDSLHVIRNTCRICQIEAPSQETLAAHRMTHMKTDSIRNPPKQVFILDKNLFPKPGSGYMRWMNGGFPPPSYVNSERTGNRLSLIGNQSTPAAAAPSGPTLFDVLEGPLSSNPSSGITRTVTLQPVYRPVRNPPPPSDADIIELSDDDDEEDDDDIVFEGSVQKGGDVTKKSLPTVQQISSQIRIEESQGEYGGSTQPGYVVDDNDLEVTDLVKQPSAEPVVRKIEDENGDDDLAVVAEVENASGTLPSSIPSGREKKFKCPKCSNSYLTNGALQQHIDGHRQDAGETTSLETYGLPVNVQAYLCRNCCIAFESKDKFHEHTNVHRDTCHTCTFCSGISFNHASIQNHMNAHENRAVLYGCGTCQLKYQSDLALLEHLNTVHSVSLFFFCKLCGFGSTDANAVFGHVQQHTNNHYNLIQRFGAVPVQLLSYEPADVENYCHRVKNDTLAVHTTADCTHRGMLLSNEMIVSCKTCHCTQSWFNYLAFNGHTEETGFPQFRLVDNVPQFPLYRHLTAANEKKMTRYGNTSTFTARVQHLPPPLPQQTAMVRRAGPQLLPIRPAPSSQVTKTANGARVILPVAPAAKRVAILSKPQGSRGAVISAKRADGSVAQGTTTMPAPQPISLRTLTNPSKCSECKASISSEFDKAMHSMHTSENLWFCRLCGGSRKTEIELFLHYVSEHLTAAYKKHKPGFKANVFRLTCPIPNCESREFMSAKAFERHVRDNHQKILPHASGCCDARFATKELQEKHDQKHQEYIENNGMDQTCCTICGTLDVWSLPKDPKTDCLQSHMIRHGLEYRSSCRGCLMQFPADVYQTLATRHMRVMHCSEVNNSLTCKICGEMGFVNEEEFTKHCQMKHIFNILAKSQSSINGELVVTIGAEYQNYVGLPVKNHRGIVITGRPLGTTDTPSTSSTPLRRVAPGSSTNASVSLADGGNAALLSIAAGIPEQMETSDQEDDDDVETIE